MQYFDETMLNQCTLNENHFSKYNGKTIESSTFYEVIDDYPGDRPLKASGLTIRFTDGTKCTICGFEWLLDRKVT
jgi:hypothetical protein